MASFRESAMKKKQAEILGSRLSNAENAKSLELSLRRHEVSDVLRATSSQDFLRSSFNDDTSLKALESSDGIKEESFQRQSFTNATDKKEETPSSHMIEEIEQNPNGSGNLVDKLYVHNLEDKILSDAKKTHEEGTSHKNNEFLLQQAEVPKRPLEDTKTHDFLKNKNVVETIPLDNLVEKLDQQNLEDKSLSVLKKMSKEKKFSPFSQETETNKNKKDKRVSLEKTPQNIKKMISVFESTLSKDRVPIKSLTTTSNRFGTSRLLRDDTVKDLYEKSDSNLKNSETSSSTRLRNSFSTGDLRKPLSSIITKDQVESDDNFVESAEINMQSNGNDPNCTEKRPKEAGGDKTMSLLSNYKTEENCHQEKGEEIESSEGADIEASNGSFGQAMKIALVIGFGVVVLLFRPKETGKGMKENTRAPRNIVVMNKRGSVEEQRRRIGVSRLS